MERLLNYLPVFLLLILFSCGPENKSVLEKLELNQVSSLIEKDSVYSNIIKYVELVRETVENDITLQSKFQDLTYKAIFNYHEDVSDSLWRAELNSKADSLFLKSIEQYQPEIDSNMIYYRKISDANGFFTAKFHSISKDHYSYSRDVKNVNIKFEVVPISKNIRGGSFRYYISTNATGKEIIDQGCRFSSSLPSKKVLTWEMDYEGEKEFKYHSTSEVKSNYSFRIEYLSVNLDGKLISKYNNDIPIAYRIYLEKDTLDDFEYAYIIKEMYGEEIKTSLEIFSDMQDSEMKKKYPLVVDFQKLVLETFRESI